jgi:hypothetical protein
VQHSAFLHSQTMPMTGYVNVDPAGFYPGYGMLGENLDMHADHFMMGSSDRYNRPGIFTEFMKSDAQMVGHQQNAAHHFQAHQMDAAMALHRSQSVMLP